MNENPQCFLSSGRCVLNPQGRTTSNLSSGRAAVQKFRETQSLLGGGIPAKLSSKLLLELEIITNSKTIWR